LTLGRNDIGTSNLTRPVIAFEPHDLVRPVGAIEHRHWPGKDLPAQVLLAQIAKRDSRLTNKAATREVDPRARHLNSPAVRRLNLGECHRLEGRLPPLAFQLPHDEPGDCRWKIAPKMMAPTQ
jgi:hypothetical protein